MSAEWPRLTVAELEEQGIILVVDGNHGQYRPLPHEFGEGRYAYIRATDMDAGLVLFDAAARINDTAFKRIRKGVGAPGDVLFSHKGTVGKLALVPMDAPLYVCSPQTTLWRTLDETKLDRRYLYCYMRSAEFIDQWFARKGETDMADYVSLTAQRELTVALPPLPEQRSIARVLGGLDDKIELNRRMNRTLEDLARGVFRSWFVDFDPVTKNGNGRAPATPAGLFPKRLVDSPIGPIPEGWRVSTIGQEVTVVGGSTPSTDEPKFWEGGKHCWVTPRDLSRLSEPVVIDCERRITDAGLTQISSGLMPKGTVLLSSRAPIGYLAIADVPVAVNQGFIGLKCDKGLPGVFALRWCEENMEEVLSRAGGTTFAEISKAAFRPIPIVVPPAEVIATFARSARGWHDQIVANVRQTRQLAALRDALLPQLLSGEIRLREADRAVDAALRSTGTSTPPDRAARAGAGTVHAGAKGRA
jgi:type I restriction enzyme S subunit